MKVKNTGITQLLYYLLLIELVLFMVKLNDKPIITLEILKWILIVTGLLFLSSIVYYFRRGE